MVFGCTNIDLHLWFGICHECDAVCGCDSRSIATDRATDTGSTAKHLESAIICLFDYCCCRFNTAFELDGGFRSNCLDFLFLTLVTPFRALFEPSSIANSTLEFVRTTISRFKPSIIYTTKHRHATRFVSKLNGANSPMDFSRQSCFESCNLGFGDWYCVTAAFCDRALAIKFSGQTFNRCLVQWCNHRVGCVATK